MNSIIKKEIKGYLTSMTGCIYIAFLMVVCGIYFTAYHLQGGYPRFAYTLQSMLSIFLIATPILTMRSMAEERKLKTDQLLLTSPVSVAGIIVGKFLALMGVFVIAVALLCVYPIILSCFGEIAFGETYVAVLGFFLMGCSFLAIGLLISSLTESQVIAAVVTFLVLFVCYVMEGISGFFPETPLASLGSLAVCIALMALLLWRMTGNFFLTLFALMAGEAVLAGLYLLKPLSFEGLIQKILSCFNISGHFSEFANGTLDLAGVTYYLSVIFVCLFLAVQSVQKRRWN